MSKEDFKPPSKDPGKKKTGHLAKEKEFKNFDRNEGEQRPQKLDRKR